MKRWRLWLGILLVFATGIIAGSVITGLYLKQRVESVLQEGPPAVKRIVMERLEEKLNLTEAQRSGIEKIAGDMQARFQEMRLRNQPEMDDIMRKGIDDMKAMLSPDQGELLEKMHQRLRDRWRMQEKQQ